MIILLLSAGAMDAGVGKLEALSLIESGNNDRAVGSAGEISRYQILPRVWRHYTNSRAYRDAGVASRVAERYLAHLEDNFGRLARREPTDFDRYVLWNAGLGYYRKAGFLPHKVHPVIRERADRFVNLRQLELNSPGRQPPR